MGTIAKALDLLDLFTTGRPRIGLSEIARLSGVNKATCHRLLGALCARGLVEQVGGAREYRLGPAVLRLAALREQHVPMREAARPVLAALAEATGETAHLSMLMGGVLRPLAHAYSPAHQTKVVLDDTDALPFHATSSGLAVLAFLPEPRREAILSAPLEALTGTTETRPEALRAQLAAVRAEGMAASRGAFVSDVNSLAMPLFDAEGAVSGALAVAAIATRMTPGERDDVRRALARAAQDITRLWGGSPLSPAKDQP